MSEPRRLNTGDARHIHRAGETEVPAAASAPATGAGRVISTAQAYSAPAAPEQAPKQPATYPPAGAAPRQPYTAAQPSAAAQPYTAAQPSAAAQRYAPAQPAAPRTAAPQGQEYRTPQRDAGTYEAARRSAQQQANARARDAYVRTAATDRSGASRQLTPAQRQMLALRQAQNQNRGVDRYAAYTTGGIARADIEARLQARQQAEQAVRSSGQASAGSQPSAQAAAGGRRIHRQPAAQPAAPQAQLAAAASEPAAPQTPPAVPAPAPDRAAPLQEERSAAAASPQAAAREEPPRADGAGSAHSNQNDARAGQNGARAGQNGARAGQYGGRGGKPPRGGNGKPAAGGSGGGKGGKNGKGKKKLRWWQILLITLLVIALILGGTLFFIVRALRPAGGVLGLSSLINTPKEFQGDEFNFLMIGIDREEPDPNNPDDENIGDGNTDMIMWVHFNKKENTMRMLQIPRDYMVSTDGSISNNYRLNNVAKTQGSGKDDANKLNMHALCEQVATMFQIPVDGYVSIHIEDLIEMVDIFGGVSLNVPFSMDYGGSHLDPGYQTLNGSAVEFLVRTRHIYPDADIGRLNMQRQFYAALFRRIKEMTMFDLFRHVPAFLNWMETDLSVSDLASFAVSVLKMPSDNMMICQMPVGTGGVMFNGQSVVYPARQADADLLNQYFRENTGPVDASQLQLVDQELEQNYGIYPSQLTPTDPNVQFMGDMMRADQEAQQDNNLDGSGVEYFEEDPPADTGADAAGDAGGEGGDTAEPAA